MKKRILSILLCLVMVVGLLPTAAFAAETTDTEYAAAATKIKFYSEDGKKTLKTLSKGQTYTVDGTTVAEYTSDGVLKLNGYNGGPIEAKKGSLTLNVSGTNTITANCGMHGISIEPEGKYDGVEYKLTVAGTGSDSSITFNLNWTDKYMTSGSGARDETTQKCFGIWRYNSFSSYAGNLAINAKCNAGSAYGYGALGINVTLDTCKLKLENCVVSNGTIENCELTSNKSVDTYNIINSNLTATGAAVGAETVTNSKIIAKTLSTTAGSYVNQWYNSLSNLDWQSLIHAPNYKLTIDNSTVELVGDSTVAWKVEAPAIEDFYCNGTSTPASYEAGIIIKNNSAVTIKNHNYGIISPMRGVDIDNSTVTVDVLSVAIGDLGTQSYGYGRGQNKYGLHVTGSSKVTLTAKEPTTNSASSKYTHLGTMALGYVHDTTTPNNTFNLSAGGLVELSTNAFNRVPAAEFPATLGDQTKVVDGAIDGGYVTATKTDTGTKWSNLLTNENETVYTYTARIEGIKPEMTGEIKYQGAAIFGQQIKASVTGAPEDATVKYQWQIKNGDTWEDLTGATSERLNLWGTDWESRVGKEIRVIAYADNCDGQLIGAALTLTKKTPTTAPDAPQLATDAKDDNTTTVKILNYSSELEYVYTTSSQTSWPTSGNKISGNSFDVELTSNVQTIYVYARYKATDSSEAGAKFAGSSVLIPAKSGSTTYARDMIYPDYGTKQPTIYLEKGTTTAVKYQLSPEDATDGLPQWKDSYTAADGTGATVTVQPTTGVSSGAKYLTITAGDTVGTVEIIAYKNKDAAYPERWTYGSGGDSDAGRQIRVIIYDPDVPASVKLPSLPVDMGAVNLYVGDTYEVTDDMMKAALAVPDDAKAGFTYSAYLVSGEATGYGGSKPVGTTSKDGSVTVASNVLTAVKVGEATVCVFARTDGTVPEYASVGYFAYFNVTVSERPTVAVESIKVAPNALTLRVGEDFTLTATKTPAAADGTITWTSSTPGVATVDTNGKVTAVAEGTATITATCGGKSATCTVEVLAAECATHNKTYTYSSSDMHLWTCSVCGAYGSEKHTGTWTADTGADTHSITCTLCTIPTGEGTENHNWVEQSTSKDAQVGVDGHTDYKCSKCNAEKSDTIPALVGIDSVALTVTAPTVGGTATQAATTATNCAVALTEWLEGDNDVYIGDAFVSGKTYTVKVALEAKDNNVFTDSTTFTINGTTIPSTNVTRSAESVTLTYQFPEIGGGTTPGKTAQTITASDVTATYGDTDKSITAATTGDGALSYEVTSGTDVVDVASDGKLTFKKAGTATVTITAAETATYTQATKDVTVTVNKKEIEIAGSSPIARPYKKGDFSVSIGGVGFSGTVGSELLVKDTDYTVTATVPNDNVGTYDYTINVTLKGDADSKYQLKTNSATHHGANIYKADPSAPTGLTGKTGNKLSTVTLPEGWTWANGDTILTDGANTYKASYAGSNNYNSASDVDVTVTASGDPTPPAPTTYAVTMVGGGTGASGEGNYAKGTTVTINAGTKSGYTFSGWTTSDGVTFANANNAETTFTMPEKAVTVTANWTKNSSGGGSYTPSYTITVEDAKNGDVKADRKSASSGTTVTITVDPDKGYTLETLTVLDKNGKEVKLTDKGNGKYTFKMPSSKVTVKATFMEDNSMLNFFVDVPADAYYADAVLWAAKEGITGGVDAVHFAPDMTCTRAQAVTFLWRAAGSPAPKSTEMPFTDVKADSYYYDAVLWAVENGITKGTGDGTTFSPDMECSRAQIVTFLWRTQKSPVISAANPFTDVKADAYYANAVLWAVENGITKGTGNGTTFSPDMDCTRAQIVTFIYRCMK